jgi:hypothetical protein
MLNTPLTYADEISFLSEISLLLLMRKLVPVLGAF